MIAELAIGILILSLLTALIVRHALKPGKAASKRRGSPVAVTSAQQRVAPAEINLGGNDAGARTPPDLLADFILVTDDNLSGDQRHALELLVSSTAQPSPVAGRIVAALAAEETEVQEITELVSSEPLITAKLLGTVNSSAFGLSREVTSAQYAINYLGANLTKDMVLKIAMAMDTPEDDVADPLAVRLIWSSSFIASGLAFQLARLNNIPQHSALATMALLSGLGTLQIAGRNRRIASAYNDGKGLLERTRIEQELLGINSAIVGAKVASRWKLPPTIQESIRFSLHLMSHHPDQCPGPFDVRNQTLIYFCTRIADLVIANSIEDLTNLPDDFMDLPEFYYLPDYFAVTGLEKLAAQIRSPHLNKEFKKAYQARLT